MSSANETAVIWQIELALTGLPDHLCLDLAE
jgi:hypothetical protein